MLNLQHDQLQLTHMGILNEMDGLKTSLAHVLKEQVNNNNINTKSLPVSNETLSSNLSAYNDLLTNFESLQADYDLIKKNFERSK